ncbi:MAG: endonuclease domain-containing protein, partial [Fibromonadaceae bacterium]|nr:endonuclease domain-containing protein [Fibromonadaceae bacterium]
PFKTAGKIDYVAAWYYKAAKEIMDTQIRAAFVSTNSITQGEQVAAVWKPLFEMFGIRINFACRTFKWSNEAKGKAAVHCVIAGFNAPPSAAHPVCLSADTPLEAGNFVQSNALNSKLNFRDIRTLPYNKKLDKLANEKRKAGWLHEVVIWNKLKNKQFLGMDFYRQQIIGNFIVDFYSPNGGIVIEADGKSHEAKVEYDKERGEYLKSLELKVIHIQVKDILKNINEVLEYLKEEIKKFPASSGVPAKQAGCAAEGGAMLIYESDGTKIKAKNINPYLIDAPNIFIESRSKPLCNVPEMQKGNIPVDDGNLIIDEKDYDDFILREPKAEKFIRQLVGAEEFINNKKRYCLWLLDALPNELKQMPEVMKRIELCRKFRLDSKKEATRKSANFPARFMEIRQPESDYILIPSHSSEKREYIPIGFINKNIITTNANLTISNATLYHFGILTSSVHMAWTRAVCGRIKSDYRYSNDIVYNNFPWPDATDEQKATIEKLAQGVLDARAKFPESSLADLYDPLTMSPELVKAHKELDKAVMKLYGFGKFPASSGVPAKQAGCADEAEIVAALMERYRKYLYI